jgi:hypothetical protein
MTSGMCLRLVSNPFRSSWLSLLLSQFEPTFSRLQAASMSRSCEHTMMVIRSSMSSFLTPVPPSLLVWLPCNSACVPIPSVGLRMPSCRFSP